jgi:rSAM/selenodomain-associated transferase 1
MTVGLLLIAKEPIPGRVKTRLCPPCTPEQAAAVARAALEQTMAAAGRADVAARTLVVSGDYQPPAGWDLIAQSGEGLGERLANAFVDGCREGPALLIGMDTPQVTGALIGAVANGLEAADAVVAPATDGGWWALALRDPAHASALRNVPMSTSDTATETVRALRALDLRVARGPVLRDVDTAADAWAVATVQPDSPFAVAVRANVPRPRVDARRGGAQ